MSDDTLSSMSLKELRDWERKLWYFVEDYGTDLTIQELYDKVQDAIEGFENGQS